MITLYFTIPYDEKNCYCVIVRKEDKKKATELVDQAYNEYLESEEIADFQSHAESLLKAHNITFEFSIW